MTVGVQKDLDLPAIPSASQAAAAPVGELSLGGSPVGTGDSRVPATSARAGASLPFAKPILKWLGGKTQLLPELIARLPRDLDGHTYHEPFFGGGALFFALRPSRAILSDVNADLIEFYRQLVAKPALVHACAERYARSHSEHGYYTYRAWWNQRDPGMSPIDRAALFLYLNRAGYNGLWRCNRRGELNTPVSDYDMITIPDPDRVFRTAANLRGRRLFACGYAEARERVRPGDFVYFDPPYVPASSTASFTAYDRACFSIEDQVQLAKVARDLVAAGARVMLSNSDTPQARNLYADACWRIDRVEARRAIAAKGSSRAAVGELIITGGY